MAGAGFESLTGEQKLRMTIHKDVRTICQEATHYVGMNIQNHAMELIAELAYKKLRIIGNDLELFAKHAKRTTINAEDVKLLVRRNPILKAHITKIAEASALASGSKDNKKRRGTSGVAPTPATSSEHQLILCEPGSSKSSLPIASKRKRADSDSEIFVDDPIDLT